MTLPGFRSRLVLVTDVEERADVRVVQGRDRLRLAIEPGAELLVRREAGRQDLDRDVALEAGVAPLPDLPHPTGAQGRGDLVRPEPCAWLDCHGYPEYSV
jgi:hypothetical protein